MNIIAWVLGSQVTSRTIKWGKSSSCECFLDIDCGGCLVVNFMLTTDIVIVNLLSLGTCRMFFFFLASQKEEYLLYRSI